MVLHRDNAANIWGFGGLGEEPEDWNWKVAEKAESDESNKIASDQILGESLPDDPFDMQVKSTFTAITGWFQEFDKDESEENIGDQKLLSAFNLVFNSSVMLQQEKDSLSFDEVSISFGSLDEYEFDINEVSDGGDVNDFGFCEEDISASVGSLDEPGFSESVDVNDNCKEEICVDSDEGVAAHDALHFALRFLGVQDLLAVERVSRSLRDAVRSDNLLWRSIRIDHPLSEKITDEALLKLTDKADGKLECLSLVKCSRITDIGLNSVLERNLRLTKLSVPGCVKLSMEGILTSLRAFKSVGAPGIMHIRVGDRKGVMNEQLEELNSLLGANGYVQLRAHEPRFYGWNNSALSSDDDRSIDIEACPKCERVGLVYDCPTEICQSKNSQPCRACLLCIERCVRCGCCFSDSDYEETFCLDSICLPCLRDLLVSEEENNASSSPTIICQATSYEFRFYG